MEIKIKPKDIKADARHLTNKLTYVILDMICSYLISENSMIKNKGYKNIQELISILDMSEYREPADIERIDFIKFGLDARLKYGLTTKEQVQDYIFSNDVVHSGNYNINFKELSNNEVKYVNDTVTNLLDASEFSAYIHLFDGMARDFDVADSYSKKDIINKWKNYIQECNSHIRSNKIEMGDEEFFSLREDIRNEYTKDTHNYLSNTSSVLYTGMQGVNLLLGGGFQSTRVYSIFGLQGEGKSLTLMNFAYQIKMFNAKYKTKDPTKVPAVVYLTLENTKRESFTRLFSIATNGGRITNFTPEEDIAKMDECGLSLNDKNGIDIIIKFKPNSSVTTAYLYDLNEELAESGYEAICFLVDYTDVIRSINRYSASEERLRLGAIINEFKAIATDLDVPIITAGQLNREANKNVDQARQQGILDLNDYVSRSNLGESMKILNNLDGALLITPTEIQNLKQKFLSIKLVKHRYELNNLKELDYNYGIYHPYESIDSPRLVCDVGEKKPAFTTTLEHMKTTTEVDKNVKAPDNSNRYQETNMSEFVPQAHKPVLNDDGTKVPYDVYWRTNPKTINDVMNVNGLTPMRQLYIKYGKKDWGNVMDSKINSLNGISRYSDLYTRFYDPEGSKEKRLVHDYNIKYGLTGKDKFKESDYPMLYSHFMCIMNGDQFDGDVFEKPVKEYIQPSDPLFVDIPEVDREALRESLSKIRLR